MKVYDISPKISSKLAVWPGDVPFQREISLSFANGDHLTLSAVKTSLHLGAHADASNHYHAKGVGIEKRPLSPYMGNCQVLDVPKKSGGRIAWPEVQDAIGGRGVLATGRRNRKGH